MERKGQDWWMMIGSVVTTDGTRLGQIRKTWWGCVKENMKYFGLSKEAGENGNHGDIS